MEIHLSLIDTLTELDPCVHCGLCLQSCPTYRETGDESEGPRGRIVLMQAIASGLLRTDDPEAAIHLANCLGCRACEPACPSGVEYGRALEKVRSVLTKSRPNSWAVRALLTIMAQPKLRTPFFNLSRKMRSLFQLWRGPLRGNAYLSLLAGTRPHPRTISITTPPEARAHPRRRRKAIIFTGCVMDGLFGHVHQATKRVLRANGIELVEAPGQGCCGALHLHYGDLPKAEELAKINHDAFQDLTECSIIVNAAGCGATLKEYEHVLGRAGRTMSSRVFDVTEFLMTQDIRVGAAIPIRVAYDPPCHLEHAQGVKMAPRAMLQTIPDLELVEVPDSDQCCGSAGIYSILHPAMARSLLKKKTDSILSTGADLVTTGNPGCVMQIGTGLDQRNSGIAVVHPVELLDWSYSRAGFYDGAM